MSEHSDELTRLHLEIRALHRPGYTVNGVTRDHTVMVDLDSPAERLAHACTNDCIPANDEHFALACVECRGSFYDGEVVTYALWPCATIRLLTRSIPEGTAP